MFYKKALLKDFSELIGKQTPVPNLPFDKGAVCSLFVEHFRATVLVTVLFPYTGKFELHLYQSMTQIRQVRILPNLRTYTFLNSHTFS